MPRDLFPSNYLVFELCYIFEVVLAWIQCYSILAKRQWFDSLEWRHFEAVVADISLGEEDDAQDGYEQCCQNFKDCEAILYVDAGSYWDCVDSADEKQCDYCNKFRKKCGDDRVG